MVLSINDIIEYDYGTVERILWIDEGQIKTYCIDLNNVKAIPIMKNVKEILEELINGTAWKLEDDKYFNIVSEEKLNTKEIENRDIYWEIIKDIVDKKNQPNIFMSKYRGRLVNEVIECKSVTKSTVYKYLRRYWVGGQVKNALIPKYKNCGGKGKDKQLKEKKIGRPRQNIDILGEGKNIDEKSKRIIKSSINKFYLNNGKSSIALSYQLMIEQYFSEKYISEDGKEIIKVKENIPTIDQFRYWYNKKKDIKKEKIYREGEKKYNLESRPLLGSSNQDALYPGALYQTDATKADVYLVSRYDRNKTIGRPILYLVIDVFSRMITGVYVGLEGPSWSGTMMALANCVMDKQKFCAEYGIEIAKEEWNIKHLPQAILADRGELEGKNVETLINSLGVDIKNTPSYRADLKGIVERKFRDIHDKIKSFVPGFIETDFRERGAKDYRLEATLDIEDFTKIIIYCILNHNNENFMEYYEREEMMIEDSVACIPREIWNWGIRNKGIPRNFSEEVVMLNLMPTDKATVTEKGIKFKKIHYSCDMAIEERWFETAGKKGSWKIEISYDPRNMNYIYIRENKGRGFTKCTILDKNEMHFNKTIYEINHLIELEKRLSDENKTKKLEGGINLNRSIKSVVKDAELKTNSNKKYFESKSEKISKINENRAIEKSLNRIKEGFELDEKTKDKLQEDNVEKLTKKNPDTKYTEENIEDDNQYSRDTLLLLKKRGK